MNMLLMVAAALSFAGGGIFMKLSEGMTNLGSTIAFLAMFVVGALLMARSMTSSELGFVYVIVLGLEAFFAVGFGAWFFRESLTPPKLIAIALILGGIALLKLYEA